MDLVVGASNDAVKSLVSKLGSLLAQEYTLIAGVRDDIQYINDELASMQAFLNKIKRAEDKDEQRQDWMKQVREVSYDIEDCMDNVVHSLDSEPRGSGALMYLRRRCYLLKTLYARHCIATEIGNLKIRAQHVSERRTRYGVENLAEVKGSDKENAPKDRPAPPPRLIGTTAPVGIEAAMEQLKPWFVKGQQIAENKLEFVAIVGFGGLGKTTLATTLYRELGDRFECRASVLASQKFNLLTLLRSLIKHIHAQQSGVSKKNIDSIEELGEKELKVELADQLKKKRYLILIDDIWSVSAWESIRDSLPKNMNGSVILITTRFKSVSEACRRHKGHVYEHKALDENNSYELFKQFISSTSNDTTGNVKAVPKQFISSASNDTTGNVKAVLKKCGGLPLAIIVVAGLVASKLKSDRDEKLDSYLADVDKDLSEDLGNNLTTEGVNHIINHCYNDLPADLKTCLLYMSMFPKGCWISRKRLIRRWIAEGFISEKHGKTVEEVAEDCFNELIYRNLIRAVNNSSNGKVKTCQIHDMVLEYIVFKSNDENFITVVGGHWQTPFPTYKVRRLSVHKSGRQEKDTVEKMKLSHVRSLTVVGTFRALDSTLQKFQILQVLDLEGCKDVSFNQLKRICNMHQLKYLSLRRTDVETIPSKIARLEVLEVLDIRETKVNKLPASVERLQRMTHLLAGDKSKRIALKLTLGITKMTALQTLSGVEICGSNTNVATAGTSNGPSGWVTCDESGEEKEKEKGEENNLLTEGENEEHASAITKGTNDGTGYPCKWQLQRMFRYKVSSAGMNKELRPIAAMENLTSLKKVTIYKLTGFNKDDNLLLLSAIEHLSSCSLKFLEIDDELGGFLDSSLKSSQAPPEHLHTLVLTGMLSRVPRWIERLHNLEKLTLSLTSLTTETLDVLAKLPELFSLIFSLNSSNATPHVLKIVQNGTLKTQGVIIVKPERFEKLKLLRLVAPVLPPLRFMEGAMTQLERIELRFRMIEGVHGVENLENLRQLVLTVSSQAPEVTRVKVSQIKILASSNRNGPSLVLDEYNESSIDQ